jgi:hypothetical protein
MTSQNHLLIMRLLKWLIYRTLSILHVGFYRIVCDTSNVLFFLKKLFVNKTTYYKFNAL